MQTWTKTMVQQRWRTIRESLCSQQFRGLFQKSLIFRKKLLTLPAGWRKIVATAWKTALSSSPYLDEGFLLRCRRRAQFVNKL
jgi:hypothetical protein